MHKDCANFTEAETFNPSRWYNPDSDGNVKSSESLVDGHWTFGYVYRPFRQSLDSLPAPQVRTKACLVFQSGRVLKTDSGWQTMSSELFSGRGGMGSDCCAPLGI